MIFREITLPVQLTRGSLVDIETSGLPIEREAEAITIGYVIGNKIHIIQRTGKDGKQAFLDQLPSLPRPIYAFNKGFEERFLGIKIDGELQLRPFERKREAIRIEGLKDPFNGYGRYARDAWALHIRNDDLSYIEAVMQHNVCCLLSELCLLISRSVSHLGNRQPQPDTRIRGVLT